MWQFCLCSFLLLALIQFSDKCQAIKTRKTKERHNDCTSRWWWWSRWRSLHWISVEWTFRQTWWNRGFVLFVYLWFCFITNKFKINHSSSYNNHHSMQHVSRQLRETEIEFGFLCVAMCPRSALVYFNRLLSKAFYDLDNMTYHTLRTIEVFSHRSRVNKSSKLCYEFCLFTISSSSICCL